MYQGTAPNSPFSSPAAHLLALHRACVHSPRSLSLLLRRYGSAEAALAAAPEIASASLVPAHVAAALRQPDWHGVENDLSWLGHSADRFVLMVNADSYPEPLRQIPDPPVILFGRGSVEALRSRQVALVGSRRASGGGVRRAARLAATLSENGIAVTSGLAVGIDGSAHKSAVAAGGQTVAVLGSGVDRIYPRSHRHLAEDIVQAGGAVVSEFATGTPPLAQHFPQRNRIISGLSEAVVVVEASLNSGSLITARMAADQGREVMAVPGSPDNPLSRGSHSLLRDGAGLVESGIDILQALGVEPQAPCQGDQVRREQGQEAGAAEPGGLSSPLKSLLYALDYGTASVESLAGRCRLTVGEVSSMLFELERRGYVALQLDGSYCRIR